MSVFEKQLPLIDIYDAAQSDTANYMTDFNDAILAIEGRMQNADNPEYIRKMKEPTSWSLFRKRMSWVEARTCKGGLYNKIL